MRRKAHKGYWRNRYAANPDEINSAVEMAEADADKAINQLNDSEFQQRTLKVREAKQKQENEANSFREGSDQSA